MTGLDPARMAAARAELMQAVSWQLPLKKWQEFDSALDLIESALATADPVKLRRGRGALAAIGPRRLSASADDDVSADTTRLDRINYIVDALDKQLEDRSNRVDRRDSSDDDNR